MEAYVRRRLGVKEVGEAVIMSQWKKVTVTFLFRLSCFFFFLKASSSLSYIFFNEFIW